MTTDSHHDPKTDAADDVDDRVLKVIATTKRLPREAVTLDSSFESLGIDSLDRLNILFGLESEFAIQINDEDAKRVENIRQMVTGVEQLVRAKGNAGPGSQAVVTPLASDAEQVTEDQVAAAEESTASAEPVTTKPASSGE